MGCVLGGRCVVRLALVRHVEAMGCRRALGVIGSDLLDSLPKWQDVHRLLQSVEWILVERPGNVRVHTQCQGTCYAGSQGFLPLCDVFLQAAAAPVPGMRVASTLAELSLVSSTSVRCAIRERRPFEDDVPVGGPCTRCVSMQRDQAL